MLTSHSMRAQFEAQQANEPTVARAPDPGPATAPDPIAKALSVEELQNELQHLRDQLATHSDDAALAAQAREAFGDLLAASTINELLKKLSDDVEAHVNLAKDQMRKEIETAQAVAEAALATMRDDLAKANTHAASTAAELAKTQAELAVAKAGVAELAALKASIAANAATIAASAEPLRPVDDAPIDKPKRK